MCTARGKLLFLLLAADLYFTALYNTMSMCVMVPIQAAQCAVYLR